MERMMRAIPLRSRAMAIALVVGAVAGIAGCIAGVRIAAVVEPEDAGLGSLLYWLYGGVIGAWAGAVMGVGLGLRAGGAAPLSSALFWTLGLLLPIAGGSGWIAVSLTDYDDHIPIVVEYGLPVVGFALSIYLGRRTARRFRR